MSKILKVVPWVILLLVGIIIFIGGPFLFSYISYYEKEWVDLPCIISGLTTLAIGFLCILLSIVVLFKLYADAH